MKSFTKLALISLAAIPVLASSQTYLHIATQLPHYDIDGITGGGPFIAQILSGPSMTNIGSTITYCDSVSQEFSLGETFQVDILPLDSAGNTSLDPWVITQAHNQANLFDLLNPSANLTGVEVQSAIQGVIWNLDGQITAGTMSSGDANTAAFANFLLGQAQTVGTTDVTGFVRFGAEVDFGDGGVGYGQSQIGAPTPEPSALLALGLPLAGFFARRRRSSK
jgi:hypothetical protein